jgi:TPR repeat protein
MGELFRRVLKSALDKWGDPKVPEDYRSLSRAWEIAQCNDGAVYSDDLLADAAEEARALTQINPPAGFSWMLRLAEQGSVWAMQIVAHDYQFGIGVAADETKAEDWLRRAFEGGSQSAQLYYGFRLMRRRAWREAEEVFRVGVVDDWAPAMYYFARAKIRQSGTRKTFAEVLPILERGTAKGSLDGELFLALQLMLGRGGLRRIPEGLRRSYAFIDLIEQRKAEMKASRERLPDAPTLH